MYSRSSAVASGSGSPSLARHQADGHHVAVGRRSLDGLPGAEAGAQDGDLIVDQRVRHIEGVDRRLQGARSRAARSPGARRPRR